MIRANKALSLILRHVQPLRAETVPLSQACGRISAATLLARRQLPPFPNSAMDGYAVRSSDCAAPGRELGRLVLQRTSRAGQAMGARILPGRAIKIMTGAPLPKGADAVVMKEYCVEKDGRVRVLRPPQRGQHIRKAGEDVGRGDLLLEPGVLLRPYEIALLAAQGIGRVPVIARPRVGLLATGDELVDSSRPLLPGKIHDSNGPALAAAVSRWGAWVVSRGIARDDRGPLKRALRRSLSGCDLLLASGGVSIGDFDYTKRVLEELGVRIIFWKVAIKPGKPLLFGLFGRKPVFGLPGNPVSALVCAEEFVRPAIEKLQGRAPAHPSYHLQGTLENVYPAEGSRQQYLFCVASGGPEGFRLKAIRPQGSAMMGMSCRANALALAPIGVTPLRPGMRLSFRWLK
ncbi:MAG: molybdopterin molybdotransferase MoeA [Elusimicrobia bacterium]|nr:molybdopterin molybdotransferase MoeA [Elusimicrobiota bacterium]